MQTTSARDKRRGAPRGDIAQRGGAAAPEDRALREKLNQARSELGSVHLELGAARGDLSSARQTADHLRRELHDCQDDLADAESRNRDLELRIEELEETLRRNTYGGGSPRKKWKEDPHYRGYHDRCNDRDSSYRRDHDRDDAMTT